MILNCNLSEKKIVVNLSTLIKDFFVDNNIFQKEKFVLNLLKKTITDSSNLLRVNFEKNYYSLLTTEDCVIPEIYEKNEDGAHFEKCFDQKCDCSYHNKGEKIVKKSEKYIQKLQCSMFIENINKKIEFETIEILEQKMSKNVEIITKDLILEKRKTKY